MVLKFTKSLLFIFFMLGSVISPGQAQDVTGLWLGVTYLSDPNQPALNYKMNLTQNGILLGGTTESAELNKSFNYLSYVSGQLTANQIKFTETDKNGSSAVKNSCFWNVNLTYNPVDESLTGTYNRINNSTCKDPESGKIELYRVVLKSDTTYCKGSLIHLTITGKNIRWYASPLRVDPLATGNTFSPALTQTTTFYVTQTLHNNESPVIPIRIEIVDPVFTTKLTQPGCGQNTGSIALSGTGSTDWQYSLNGGAFQTTPSFSGLTPGPYTVTAKNATGCQSQQSVTLTAEPGPTISDLKATPPQCGTATGEVNVVASGGKTPLTYSMDYGNTYQTNPTFSKLSGGTYTFRVRDANGCEVNKALSLPPASPMEILNARGLPTTCGKANGEVTMTTSGGSSPVQYSIDNQTFQPDNTFTRLPTGDYTLLARDAKGCTVSKTIRVGDSTGPQPTNAQTTTEGCGQQNGAIVIATSGSPDATDYSIDGQTFMRTTNFSGLKAGTYTLTTRDANNCRTTQTVVVPLDCANHVYLPTAFSPNADRMNDALTVHFAFSSLTVSQFTVYDRWGAVLYNRANFVLSNGESVWDGQINGQSAPIGVYVYRLDAQFPDGTQLSRRESVSLLNE